VGVSRVLFESLENHMKILEEEVTRVLTENKGWHTFVNFIPQANKLVPPELAVRCYLANHGNPQRDLEDQIRNGRRRILAETFRDLKTKGVIEFRDPITHNDQDSREYHLISSYVPKTPKEKKELKKSEPVKEPVKAESPEKTTPRKTKLELPVKKTVEDILQYIETVQDVICIHLDDSRNKIDVINLLHIIKKLINSTVPENISKK